MVFGNLFLMTSIFTCLVRFLFIGNLSSSRNTLNPTLLEVIGGDVKLKNIIQNTNKDPNNNNNSLKGEGDIC